MPCHPFTTPDGVTGILCTRRPKKKKRKPMFNIARLKEDRHQKAADRRASPAPLIHVVNCHHPISSWPTQSWHYIGRPMGRRSPVYHGSALGNPFIDGPREQIVADYRRWLWQKISSGDDAVLDELTRILRYGMDLDGVSLGCWCAPKQCHGDVVAAAVKWLWDQGVRPTDWNESTWLLQDGERAPF